MNTDAESVSRNFPGLDSPSDLELRPPVSDPPQRIVVACEIPIEGVEIELPKRAMPLSVLADADIRHGFPVLYVLAPAQNEETESVPFTLLYPWPGGVADVSQMRFVGHFKYMSRLWFFFLGQSESWRRWQQDERDRLGGAVYAHSTRPNDFYPSGLSEPKSFLKTDLKFEEDPA